MGGDKPLPIVDGISEELQLERPDVLNINRHPIQCEFTAPKQLT